MQFLRRCLASRPRAPSSGAPSRTCSLTCYFRGGLRSKPFVFIGALVLSNTAPHLRQTTKSAHLGVVVVQCPTYLGIQDKTMSMFRVCRGGRDKVRVMGGVQVRAPAVVAPTPISLVSCGLSSKAQSGKLGPAPWEVWTQPAHAFLCRCKP